MIAIAPKFTWTFRSVTNILKNWTEGILLSILNVFTAKPNFIGSRDILCPILLFRWLCHESQKLPSLHYCLREIIELFWWYAYIFLLDFNAHHSFRCVSLKIITHYGVIKMIKAALLSSLIYK